MSSNTPPAGWALLSLLGLVWPSGRLGGCRPCVCEERAVMQSLQKQLMQLLQTQLMHLLQEPLMQLSQEQSKAIAGQKHRFLS